MDYKGKIVVVTGAARGLGRACSVEYGKEGAILVLVDIAADRLAATVKDMKSQGFAAHSYQCDVSNSDDVECFGKLVLRDVGIPDIIHNNAMRSRTGGIVNLDISNVEHDIGVNVLGYLRIVQVFLSAMIRRGSGWIVNTASPLGLIPPRGAADNLLSYCLCKAANISMSQSMAVSLKQYGIGVTVLYPDMTLTEAADELRGTAPPEFAKTFTANFYQYGKSAESVARQMIAAIKQQKFCVSAAKRFESLLIEWAEHGMDPNVQYSQDI
ncbi:uncharacterized protein Z518_03326 [Rhinocladiella mackenziei CBS 650.93]|uniref:Rhinocladiella mackenziei CBS 650.93 unplaced genomic scaffold supercont1.2, whole genome shotgun sequence n=1 Tax=Rhinocladiella mackenziei CBS 650.93 TaxID=1442369 RepID=A0A0D2IRQ0_9EURO|nr:uncharacterized protein Z518_03326 [Rhinocladiella mackenziei CBS 650.93]KIX08669.1 hypothetical protein Z518_03326 [Rhinocladiella mackenziei CBS 650.93]